jgi:hypothetical protein
MSSIIRKDSHSDLESYLIGLEGKSGAALLAASVRDVPRARGSSARSRPGSTVGSARRSPSLSKARRVLRTTSEIAMTIKNRTVAVAEGTVVLGGVAVSLAGDLATDFTRDCARSVEGLLADSEVRAKYEVSDAEWEGLASNELLLRAVRAEVERRIANGECAREAAQRHVAHRHGGQR